MIAVEIDRLLHSSKIIDDKNDEFKKLISELYLKIDSLQNVWSGKDNIAFSNKIKEFQNFINSISMILSQYSEFLKNSANAYSQTQDEVYQGAIRLKS